MSEPEPSLAAHPQRLSRKYQLVLDGLTYATGSLSSLSTTFGNLDGRNFLSDGDGAPGTHAYYLRHAGSVFDRRIEPGQRLQLLDPAGKLLLTGTIPGPQDDRWQSAGQAQRFLLVDPEMGVYLGSCMGMGFWSKLDPAGQSEAVAFPTVADAEEFMAQWDSGRPADAWLVPVWISGADGYASMDECIAAGLPRWNSDVPGMRPPERQDAER